MTWRCHRQSKTGGSAPATPGFNAVAPEWLNGAADAAPAVPAAESTLGSHPCVALSSAQVFPEWTTSTPLCNTFSTDGDYPLNFVSHDWGSLQFTSPFPVSPFGGKPGRAGSPHAGARREPAKSAGTRHAPAPPTRGAAAPLWIPCLESRRIETFAAIIGGKRENETTKGRNKAEAVYTKYLTLPLVVIMIAARSALSEMT